MLKKLFSRLFPKKVTADELQVGFELTEEKRPLSKEEIKEYFLSKGHEIADIEAYWCIHFWDDGALTGNYLKICLLREDVIKLRDYLKEIVG